MRILARDPVIQPIRVAIAGWASFPRVSPRAIIAQPAGLGNAEQPPK